MVEHDVAGLDFAVAELRAGLVFTAPPTQRPTSSLLDIYKMHAAVSLGILYSEVTQEARRTFKARIFALLYSPSAEFRVPQAPDLLLIYTKEQVEELCSTFKVEEGALHSAINRYFDPGVTDAKTES